MKVTDLRIGNYVYDLKLNSVIKIISFHGICNVESRPDNYEPIPLTEEILLKCGFEKSKGSGYSYEYKNHYFIDVRNRRIITIADVSDRKNENSGYSFICAFNKSNIFGIEYLHQLQNLYFVLTNKELEINL